jgi:hypothetical protein
MTRREQERVRRAAAFIAIGEAPLSTDAKSDRWRALQRWRGNEGEAPDQIIAMTISVDERTLRTNTPNVNSRSAQTMTLPTSATLAQRVSGYHDRVTTGNQEKTKARTLQRCGNCE